MSVDDRRAGPLECHRCGADLRCMGPIDLPSGYGSRVSRPANGDAVAYRAAVATRRGAGVRVAGADRLRAGWRYLPLAIAGVYVVLLVLKLSAIIGSIEGDADAVVALQLGRLVSSHSGTVVLGDSAWYSTLLFEIGTRWLPFYRAIWGLAPFVASAVAFAATAWSVSRVAGRWAAAMTLSLLLCPSAGLLTQVGMLDNHVLTWFSGCVLIAGLIWVLTTTSHISAARLMALAVALGLVVAPTLASDPLLYCAGVVPMLAAAAWARMRSPGLRSRDGWRFALGASVTAALGSIVVDQLMRQHGIISTPGWSVAASPIGAISGHISAWARSLAVLGGNSGAGTGSLVSIAATPGAALAIVAVMLIPVVARRELSAATIGRARLAPAPETVSAEPAAASREAFVVAWSLSALLISLAFVLSNAPAGVSTVRYLVGVLIAAAALAPLLARRPASIALLVTAASVYCVFGITSIAGGSATQPVGVTQAQVNMFVRLARREHVKRGYASFWDASPITWKSNFDLLVYPAGPCPQGFCHAILGYDSAWYLPGKQRTFLITDTARPGMPFRPPSLGPPAKTFRVGQTYEFLVYDYDIGGRVKR